MAQAFIRYWSSPALPLIEFATHYATSALAHCKTTRAWPTRPSESPDIRDAWCSTTRGLGRTLVHVNLHLHVHAPVPCISVITNCSTLSGSPPRALHFPSRSSSNAVFTSGEAGHLAKQSSCSNTPTCSYDLGSISGAGTGPASPTHIRATSRSSKRLTLGGIEAYPWSNSRWHPNNS